jgi:cation diffusion facilitator CzcD-associated flavoprotein CzcO
MRSERYDVVIVGAGFAGISTGYATGHAIEGTLGSKPR